MKGQVREAAGVAEQVLARKPWHLGALSGVALCYDRLGDTERAAMWRRKQIPERRGEERTEWCRRHVADIISYWDGSCEI